MNTKETKTKIICLRDGTYVVKHVSTLYYLLGEKDVVYEEDTPSLEKMKAYLTTHDIHFRVVSSFEFWWESLKQRRLRIDTSGQPATQRASRFKSLRP